MIVRLTLGLGIRWLSLSLGLGIVPNLKQLCVSVCLWFVRSAIKVAIVISLLPFFLLSVCRNRIQSHNSLFGLSYQQALGNLTSDIFFSLCIIMTWHCGWRHCERMELMLCMRSLVSVIVVIARQHSAVIIVVLLNFMLDLFQWRWSCHPPLW